MILNEIDEMIRTKYDLPLTSEKKDENDKEINKNKESKK